MLLSLVPILHFLEELDVFAFDLAQQLVSQTAGAETEPLVGEPLLAKNLLDDGVVGDGVHDAVNAASGLETDLYASLIIIFLDGLTHNISSLRCGRDLLLAC